MGERERVRRKITWKLLSDPLALIPTAAGLSALVVSWATGLGGALLPFAGAIGILAGIGMYLTRWITGMDTLSRKAVEELQEEDAAEWNAKLDTLDRRLQGDRDPRTEELLRELRSISAKIRKHGISEKMNRLSRLEITVKVDQLFNGCVAALEQSLGLLEEAQAMGPDDTRFTLLSQREAQIREVQQCLGVLHRIYVEGAAPGEPGSATDSALARIRDELDQSLEVARRVEERMKSLERDIHQTPRETE